ncbi:GNAT family N-acetyltransferase [Bacillus sp. FJAT-49711]|uniref:GNAT family N-acetyltransferase n=1 Tax=Bacillus sp. FJAT-49711 TaxID=2833585 RepID=UPI001BC9A7A9|nr:GNAT family protein [Bacillus sp. FJAT-49711]MBS4219809.1 GNAT family N-acetyltransferase [Bacillus sp. FJAT-49711]
MDKLRFYKFENEINDLVSFMTNNTWEYHADPKPSTESIVKAFHNGWYQEGRETYWVENCNEKIGLIIIHDIDDTIPLFDIRLARNARGKGIGTKAVRWMTDYIFSLPDKKIRIEAYTRRDNFAMRKTLTNCGFVKEGYLRNAWENKDGSVSDSICYAIIRTDWENKEQTPIKLNDLPF